MYSGLIYFSVKIGWLLGSMNKTKGLNPLPSQVDQLCYISAVDLWQGPLEL